MTLRSECIEDFLNIFEKYKTQIRNAKGCSHLALLRDQDERYVFFTYSKWDNEKHLDDYRYSDTFATVWPLVKVMFGAPAEAWTVDEVLEM